MKERIEQAIQKAEDMGYEHVGFRLADSVHEIGEELDWSRHNPDREDERDFPKFGTDEYNELPELDGTSAWEPDYMIRVFGGQELEYVKSHTLQDHLYVIAGNDRGNHDDPDDGEMLIADAVVIDQIF